VTDTVTRTREAYVHLISTQSIPTLKAPTHDFAEKVYDWLYLNMPEELDGVSVDTHAIEVAAVHLGLCEW
jgi:hypothetical protein